MIDEISVAKTDMIKSFAVFFLLLVGNFVYPSLFSCSQIDVIRRSILLQWLFSFLLFFFLVTIVSNTGNLKHTPPVEKFFYTLEYFIGFVVLMRLDYHISILCLILIYVIYFLELNKDFYEKHGINKDSYWLDTQYIKKFPITQQNFITINKIENGIYYTIVGLMVIGIIKYFKDSHFVIRTKNMSWSHILFNTHLCKMT